MSKRRWLWPFFFKWGPTFHDGVYGLRFLKRGSGGTYIVRTYSIRYHSSFHLWELAFIWRLDVTVGNLGFKTKGQRAWARKKAAEILT